MIFLLIVLAVIIGMALCGAVGLLALWLLNKLIGESAMRGLGW